MESNPEMSAATLSDVSADRALSWLPIRGEMARQIREKDWSATPVGPIERWPQSLKIVVRLMLTSRYAMWMAWGPELTFFCNDAYKPTLGVKEAWALGSGARKVWEEIWPDIGPRIDGVLLTGEATWDEGLLLFLERSGYPEETYHTFSYSPISGDTGDVQGMLCVVTEETERVIGERRVTFLREVAAELAATSTEAEVLQALEHQVRADGRDLPFTLVYLLEPDGRTARLASAAGIETGHPAAPSELSLDEGEAIWPLSEALSGNAPVVVPGLSGRFAGLPVTPWKRAPEEAVLVPLAQQAQERPAGFLVAALCPFRKLDTDYRGFVSLLAGQLASGLANARAYEAERRRAEALAEIDRAKTAFFSNVSHEFRTPLTLMLGPIEDILSKPNGEVLPEDRELLTVVHRNALRLQKLVNSLLDFSRIEAGRARASYQPVDLCALTAELASNFRSAIEKAGLRLEIQCDRSLSEPVYVDLDQWEKIILNLLSNAFKYTFEGEIRVAVREVDGSAEVEVSDTGTGIPEADLPLLFERFHRVENARGRTHEGSGIGLALVQELTKLHGGSIRVSSRVGEGTAFILTVPFGTAHLPEERLGSSEGLSSTAVGVSSFVEEALRWLPAGEAVPAFSSPQTVSALVDAPLSGARARIVLADDNADMREYVRRLLSPRYDVEMVADGRQALDAVRREMPDLLLSDVMMPELDGFGLLQEVRASPATRALPVILLSARAGEEARIEGLRAGADDYVTKPFGARELLARVDSQLELARVRSEMMEYDAKLQAIFEQSPMGMYFVDAELRLRQVNPRAWPVFADLPDLIGRPFREIMETMWSPEEASGIMEAFRHTLETGEPYYAPGFTSFRTDRSVQEYYHWELARVTLPSGVPAGVLCTFFDVSEHVRARQALEEAVGERERAEAEVRQEADRVKGLARVALELNGTHSVDAVAHVMAREAQFLIGARQAVVKLRNGPDRSLTESAVVLAANPGEPPRKDLLPEAAALAQRVCEENRPERLSSAEVARRFSGSPAAVSSGWLAIPLIGRDGQNLGLVQLWDKLVGEFTDADEAVLTQLAQMGAIAMENAGLYEDLRDQDRRKDEFLAMLAHELRNPLSPIRNALHLLQHAQTKPEQQGRMLSLIGRQVEIMVRLVDDLLDVSRVTRGKIQLEWEPVMLAQVVRQAVETCQPLIDQQQHALEIRMPQPLTVLGDLTRLTQVVANLLNNAAKYTRPNGSLTMTVEPMDGRAVIRVRDSGMGIAPEMLPHVFELFTQAERSLDRAQGGLGIGLALSRKLVELHGGTLQAYSAGVDQGSEFTLTLPLMEPSDLG